MKKIPDLKSGFEDTLVMSFFPTSQVNHKIISNLNLHLISNVMPILRRLTKTWGFPST